MSSSNNAATTTNNTCGSNQNHVGSQIGQDDVPAMKVEETSKSEGTQAGGPLHSTNMASTKSTSTGTRTKDYNDEMVLGNLFFFYFEKFLNFFLLLYF